MTNITIPIEDVVDYDQLSDAIIENLSEDIHHQNPEWWAEKVCKPLQEELKILLEDRTLIQNSITQILTDYVGFDYIKDKVDRAIREQVQAEVKARLNNFDVTLTRRLTDVV